MNRDRILVLFLCALAPSLFFHAGPGLGESIFVGMATLLQIWAHPEGKRRVEAKILISGTLGLSLAYTLHGNGFAQFGMWACFSIHTLWVQFPTLKTLPLTLGLLPLSLVFGTISWVEDNLGFLSRGRAGKFFHRAPLALISLPALGIFFYLFQLGNSQFSDLMNAGITALADALEKLDLQFFLWITLGLLIGASLVYAGDPPLGITLWDVGLKSKEIRVRGHKNPFSMLYLKREALISLLFLIPANLLLLIQNGLDIYFVWGSAEVRTPAQLSEWVHAGTFALILSILLSAAVIWVIFRKNQLFYTQNKPMRHWALLWLGQNAFLALSVGMRNAIYVKEAGLADLRIGVIFFLALTLFGLWTLGRRILRRDSMARVVRRSSWAGYSLFWIWAATPWPLVMARYNLTPSPGYQPDPGFLLAQGPLTYPALWENRDRLEPTYDSDYARGYPFSQSYLQESIAQFMFQYAQEDLRGWTLGEAHVYRYFKTQGF